MIIPSQHASRVARAAAGGGGGGDVTPAAVNWANVSGAQTTQTAMVQITGIDQTITLRVAYSGSLSNVVYSVQSSASFGTGTSISNNGTFTVSNNQYVGFGAQINFSGTATQSFTITNVSDSDAVLDTFTITCTFEEE